MSEEYDEIPIEQGEDDQVSVDMDDYEDEEEQPNDASFYSMQMEDSGLCLSVSPINPCLVCVGCLDNSAKLITVDSTGVPQSAIDMLGHTDSVVSVKFNAEGSIIATGSYDCTIKLWNPTNGARISEIDETGSDVEIISFHPTENVLVAGCADGSVWVWSIEGSEAVLRHMLRGHSHGAAVRTLSFLGRGNQGLLSTSEEGVAIVWNLTNGQIVHKTKSFGEAIVSASVHVSKPIYAIGLENGATYIIHAENGKILHKLTTKGSVESVCFSACGMLLAIATLEGILEIWHMEQLNGYPRHKIDLGSRLASELPPEEMPEVGFTKVVWHPDQSLRCLVSIGKSGRVDLWNAMTGEHLTQLEGHSADVMDVTIAVLQDPQGRKIARIISTCDEGYVKMFTVSEDSE
jgi:WD40 repeat protein